MKLFVSSGLSYFEIETFHALYLENGNLVTCIIHGLGKGFSPAGAQKAKELCQEVRMKGNILIEYSYFSADCIAGIWGQTGRKIESSTQKNIYFDIKEKIRKGLSKSTNLLKNFWENLVMRALCEWFCDFESLLGI